MIRLVHVPRRGPQQLPIWQQLKIEEGLLKATLDNWCIVNGHGHPDPPAGAVVLGISGKPQELVHLEEAELQGVQLIKRFTGGGTVFVDRGTRFVSFVCNQAALPQVEVFPRPIMAWTGNFYAPIFRELQHPDPLAFTAMAAGRDFPEGFHVVDNDYCIGPQKFGGNAQGITRDRWLHHTSFLWESDLERMHSLLTMPKKVPAYREGRAHRDFVRPLASYFRSPGGEEVCSSALLEEAVIARLGDFFEVERVPLEEALHAAHLECHRSNRLLDYREIL